MRETLRMILLTFVLFTDGGGGSNFLTKDIKKVKKLKKDLTCIVNL